MKWETSYLPLFGPPLPPLVNLEEKMLDEVHTFPSGTKDTRLSRYVGKEATTTLLGDVRFWPYGPKPNIT